MAEDNKTATVSNSAVKRLVICDEVDIKRLTIEWPTNKNGYEAAHEFILAKYGSVSTRTVRLGPKAISDFRVDPKTSQWVVDIYI
jgi:hypothetical protein